MSKYNELFQSGYLPVAIEWMGEQIPGGFYIYRADEEAEILYVNNTVLRIYGCETLAQFKELTGNSFRGMVHPDDYQEIDESIQTQIKDVEHMNLDYIEYRIIRRDGVVRWVDDYGHFAQLPGYGDVYYVFISDITEKHLAQKENLRRSNVYNAMAEQLYAAAANSLAAYRANLTTGELEYVSGTDLYDSDRLGTQFSECERLRRDSFLVAGDKARFEECFRLENLMERFYKGEPAAAFVAYCRRASGKQCFVRYTRSVAYEPDSGALTMFCTESEYNNEKASEVLNEKVLVRQYDMVTYIVDNNYSVVIGDAAKIGKGSIFPVKHSGVYSDYICNQVLPAASTSVHDIEELRASLSTEAIAEHLETDESYTINVTCEIDGSTYYKRFTYYAVDKDTKFFLLLKSDVTDVLRQEHEQNDILADALKVAEHANVAKTAFLSNMSHEIRTPMNAIIGLNSIALKDSSLPEQTRKYLLKIGKSAGHLLNLINDILDMSRIESGRVSLRKEEFSMSEIFNQINTMIQPQCRDKGLDYRFTIEDGVEGWYFGDDTKLKQVLINILSNAVKFTDAPGTITFHAEMTAEFENRSTLRFTITDTGIGIDEAFLPRIFDPFTQENASRSNKFGSTGLGMAITKNLVEMMNGTVSVKSKKGEGSEFTITITLKNCEKPGDVIKSFETRELRVLVVDDDEIALEHARLVLEDIGIAADAAASGEEALQMLGIHHAKHEPYHIALIDWRMNELDGIEVTREIRRLYHEETRVIVLTAYNWEDVIDEALAAGADRVVSKTVFSSDVKGELERVLKHLCTEQIERKPKATLEGRRVLLAEDMFINAEIMKQLLAIKDMNVEHAENGKLALEMFKDSELSYYDAVLMDVRMPVMDGLETAAAIRALPREDAKTVPIIALTANAFDEDVQRSLQSGMNAHLSKPVEPNRLYQTLEELMN